MDLILNNAFGNVKKLWHEFFEFKVFKRLPKWCAIILFIFAVPFFVSAAVGTGFYAVICFFFYIISVPTRSLHKILQNEGKEIHFLAQAFIYLACFPVIFFCYFFLVFMLPFLFIQYFFINLNGYIASYGGIKFEAFLDRERGEKEVSGEMIQKKVWIPYFAVTAGLLATALGLVVPALIEYLMLPTVVFFFLFYVAVAIGCLVFAEYKFGHSESEKPAKEVAPSEAKEEKAPSKEAKEKPVEEAKEIPVVEKKPKNRGKLIDLIFSIATFALVVIATALCFFTNPIGAGYPIVLTLNEVLFLSPIGLALVGVAFGIVNFFINKKWSKFVSIGLMAVAALAIVALPALGLVFYILNNPETWYFGPSMFVILGVAVVALVAAIIAFFAGKFVKSKE